MNFKPRNVTIKMVKLDINYFKVIPIILKEEFYEISKV